jgi:hypothetical protein
MTTPNAAGRPWLVAIRSTINNAIPKRIRSAPTAAGSTIGGSAVWLKVRYASKGSIVDPE